MIETNLSKHIYNGNGTTTEFPFYFQIFEAQNLKVTVTNNNLEYSETSYPEIDVDNVTVTDTGGTLTYYHTDDNGDSVPLPSGYTLALTRNMPFLQETDIPNGSAFRAEIVEDNLDLATAERQQLKEEVSRCVKISETSEIDSDTLYIDNVFNAEQNSIDSANLAKSWAIDNIDDRPEGSSKHWSEQSEQAYQNAENYASQSKNWAIGSITDNADGSAKYWAEQAELTKNTVYNLSVSYTSIDTDDENPTQGAVIFDEPTNNLHFYIPRGEQGIQGVKGEQGIQGVAGQNGTNGTNGVDGQDGAKGDTGEQGIQGIQGEKGDKGDKGDPGGIGDKGEQGEMGDSPFAQAFGNFRLNTDGCLYMDYVGDITAAEVYTINESGELVVSLPEDDADDDAESVTEEII